MKRRQFLKVFLLKMHGYFLIVQKILIFYACHLLKLPSLLSEKAMRGDELAGADGSGNQGLSE
jgi:hypothetical protein